MRLFFSLVALVVISFLLAACNSGQPNITVEATSLDLGDVVNGDIVSRDLTLTNEGDADLVIDSIITSCTCTQASVNPMTIAPNQSGVLHIEFDSGFHGPDLTGPLIRQVFINSNDPRQPEFKVELIVNVEARNSASG
jgi:uncharacterized protein YcfL